MPDGVGNKPVNPWSPPAGAALFRIVQIKPAEDPNLQPAQTFIDATFWYDPCVYGHSAGLRQVHPVKTSLPFPQPQSPPRQYEYDASPSTPIEAYAERLGD